MRTPVRDYRLFTSRHVVCANACPALTAKTYLEPRPKHTALPRWRRVVRSTVKRFHRQHAPAQAALEQHICVERRIRAHRRGTLTVGGTECEHLAATGVQVRSARENGVRSIISQISQKHPSTKKQPSTKNSQAQKNRPESKIGIRHADMATDFFATQNL